jgi:DNA-binding response OmpR family regulator
MNGRTTPQVVPLNTVPPPEAQEYRPVILVVDDESVIAETVAEILSRHGYAAMAVYDANEALETALLTPPEMLITDVILPGMNGIDLAIKMRHIFPSCKILLFSGQPATYDLLAVAENSGHRFTLLRKPVDPKDLVARVAQCLNYERALAR